MRRGSLAVAVVAALLLVPVPALAAPGDQPAGPASLLDSPELDELQRRAAEVQADLQERQARVVEARAALDVALSRSFSGYGAKHAGVGGSWSSRRCQT